jgi:hypothetical protein
MKDLQFLAYKLKVHIKSVQRCEGEEMGGFYIWFGKVFLAEWSTSHVFAVFTVPSVQTGFQHPATSEMGPGKIILNTCDINLSSNVFSHRL